MNSDRSKQALMHLIISIVSTLTLVGLVFVAHNDSELKKLCTERNGTFANGMCFFGAKP